VGGKFIGFAPGPEAAIPNDPHRPISTLWRN
jgi:hypothetical protein